MNIDVKIEWDEDGLRRAAEEAARKHVEQETVTAVQREFDRIGSTAAGKDLDIIGQELDAASRRHGVEFPAENLREYAEQLSRGERVKVVVA
jgi:ATPase subunit of ABC transporter with duplicated ATPase domains